MNLKILVTGASSGIGRYLCERLNGIPFTRENKVIPSKNIDVVIHCANNRNKFPQTSEYYNYINDNFLLTQKLLNIECEIFIFFSTCEVYPFINRKEWFESVQIPISYHSNVYPYFKLASEALIQNSGKKYLIFRPSAFLGNYAEPNTIIKIAKRVKFSTNLSPESDFNCITYDMVYNFLIKALNNNLFGIYNLVASDNIRLGDLAKKFSSKVKFGSFNYRTGKISNKKIITYDKSFSISSYDILDGWIKGIK